MNKEVNKIFEDFSKSIAANPASSELKDIAESVGKEMLRVEGFDLTCILTIEKAQTTIYLNIILWGKYRQMGNASYTKEEHEIMLKFKDAKRYLVNYLNENIQPEISEDAAAQMIANAVENGLKYTDKELQKICEGLKSSGYISSSKKFFDSIKGERQGGKVWLKAKAIIIYLIEKIREDGKCNYAEISENLNIEIKANNKKGGYNEIDIIIKKATMY